MKTKYENRLKILQQTNVIYQMKAKSNRKMSFLWVYMVIPFFITSVLLFSFAVDGVLIGAPECCSKASGYLSFVRDTSCSICLILFFVMSYYLAGSYPAWTNESFELNKTEETKEEFLAECRSKRPKAWMSLLLVGAIVLGILVAILVSYCVYTASGIQEGMWTFDLSGRSRGSIQNSV